MMFGRMQIGTYKIILTVFIKDGLENSLSDDDDDDDDDDEDNNNYSIEEDAKDDV